MSLSAKFGYLTKRSSRKTTIAATIAIIVVVIIDILATRQFLPYDNFSGAIIFALNIVAYGAGSGIILANVEKTSAAVKAKSPFLNAMFWMVAAVQFTLLAILITMAVEFYYYNVSVRHLTYTVFAISTIAATAIMGITSIKFFSWYRLSDKNTLILVCGLATASLATAMVFDASAKLLLVRAVDEESPPQAIPQDGFIYEDEEKYQGEVQYKVVKPEKTTIYIVPWSITLLYHYVNGWIPITISFVFTWAITAILLRQYHYHRVAGKLPVILWVMLILPLALYMVGRTSEWYTVFTGQDIHWRDLPNGSLLKNIFRAASISGSIMFGVAFFIMARRLPDGKVKDYLTIAAMGAAMIGITLSPSGQQQTFGIAGRSLTLLASFLLSFGFYLSAVSMAQDRKLRQSIRSVTGSRILSTIATAQLEQQINKRVLDVVKKERETIEEQTGIQPPLEDDVKRYLDKVLQEVYKSGSSQTA